jgi:hypothetical protein
VTHTWWYLARSSGLVAWALLAMAVLWGLILATRIFNRVPSPKWFNDLHRFLGGAAVAFTAVHIAGLVADSYVHFGAAEVLVPLASKWKPIPVAWGVISMWVLLAVEISSLMMRHLPRRVWHGIHMSSFVLFVTATVHALTAGTDTRGEAFLLVLTAAFVLVLLLTLVRISARMQPARRPSAAASSASARRAADTEREVVAGTRNS